MTEISITTLWCALLLTISFSGLIIANAIRDSHKTVTCTYNWPEYNHGDLRHPNTPKGD